MRASRHLWSALCSPILLVLPHAVRAQGTAADYALQASLAQRTRNLVTGLAGAPNWIDGSDRFWYTLSVKGGSTVMLVDPNTGTKAPLFDHQKLAASLSTAAGQPFTAITLPVNSLSIPTVGVAEMDAAGRHWKCLLTDYRCTSTGDAQPGGRGGRGGDGGRGGAGAGAGARGAGGGRGGRGGDSTNVPVRVSPDGKTEASVQNFDIWVRPVGTKDWVRLSWDGSVGNAYRFQSMTWSPDSRKIAAYRVRPGDRREVHYIESSPTDQLQPKYTSLVYAKPGDVLDLNQPVLFDVASRKETNIDTALFPNAYAMSQLVWRKDSRRFTFEYNQRGHQVLRIVEVDATTGSTRAVVSEETKTFIDYRTASGNQTDSGDRYRFDLQDGNEIIWMSARDGYNQLYLFDGATGKVKNRITTGNWAVRNVERVDTVARQIWFRAGGIVPGQDPYLLQYYRVNFDGTGLTAISSGDGTHAITWAPDSLYYIDTWQRVDLAPVSVLRRTANQQVVVELARGDASDLLKTGWRFPEVFVAKGRDGVTDIYGIIIRPTNFDPKKKYPVIENIYAGPQGSFVPKSFSTQTGMQSLAELGFIVVQVDGMGTANRSKAFHEVAWQNLADAGFPDRILWHKAIAAKYPSYDITRVGVYGTSAGGQNAMGALLWHPEFYKAAFAASGSHDNRMDKIWWNELWMGYPIGPQYAASSNVDNAWRLQGKLMLVAGELDNNVDPSSTMQVVNALIKAGKYFDFLYIPGAGHTSGGAYGDIKRNDFFVQNLMGVTPPVRNQGPPLNAPGGRGGQ